MGSYEFIALLDIDEAIIPVKHRNWNEMMNNLLMLSLKVGMKFISNS